LDHLQLAVRIDRTDALGHRRRFLSPDLAVHRVELAVHVGDADFIEINHTDTADPGTRQPFHRPRSHPADSDNHHPCRHKALQRAHSVKPRDSTEAVLCFLVQHPGGASGLPLWLSMLI